MRQPQFEDGRSGFNAPCSAAKPVLILALLLASLAIVHAQQKELPVPDKPTRVFTVQGQVSLPEGMPAGQILVTLINREGIPRQTYTTEHGRFEFPVIPEGSYTLSAKSMSDSNLVSESVDTDTNRTATGNLNVNLSLRRESKRRLYGGARSHVQTVLQLKLPDNREEIREFSLFYSLLIASG